MLPSATTSETFINRGDNPALGALTTGTAPLFASQPRFLRGRPLSLVFVHPVIAVDAESAAVLGVVGAEIWTRSEERTPEHRDRAFEDKESVLWLNGAKIVGIRLAEAARSFRSATAKATSIHCLPGNQRR